MSRKRVFLPGRYTNLFHKIIGTDEHSIHLRPMLVDYGRKYVERCSIKGMVNTAEKYGGHITKLAEYLGKKVDGTQNDITLDEVTEDWILKWSVWLRNHGTKSENTMHRRMAFISTLFLDAIKRNQMKVNPMAFLEFKGQRVRKPRLYSATKDRSDLKSGLFTWNLVSLVFRRK